MTTPLRQKFPDVERPKILAASQTSLWRNEGEEALKYLQDKRHLADDVIKAFAFGYCPRNADHQLAGRIIMPLFDSFGEVVAITSRDVEAPKKWQHWHESFDKSNYLYGLHLAKKNILRTGKAIIVEGQFDVTYLHTAGFNMTVGLCGSSISIMHISKLARYCSEIYLVLDPDTSGEEAVKRASDLHHKYSLGRSCPDTTCGCSMMLSGGSGGHGITVIPVSLPDKLDPDEFVYNRGAPAFVDLLKRNKQIVVERI